MITKKTRRDFIKTLSLSGLALSMSDSLKLLASDRKKPNIIFILADDLGYSDLSCYGQKKFSTPNIDRLASEGIRFTQHYSGSPVCAPSRCSLLTGLHTGHSYIRDNDEMTERGDVWSDPIKFEGQRPIPEGTVTLPLLLKKNGYTTAAIGKWGLGAPGTPGVPNKQGFDFFYGYICQRIAHTHYPPYLWRNDKKEFLPGNKNFVTHEKLPADRDPLDPESYKKYEGTQYAFDLMVDESLKFISQNRNKNFFLYFAPELPHVSLQVPDDSRKNFENEFDDRPYKGNNGYLPQRKPRAAYAGMISRLDSGVGKIVSLIKKLNLEDETLIIFTSDNGATFKTGGYDPEFFKSNNGFNGAKASLFEGGIRVPLIAKWGKKIKAGSISDHVCSFWDFMPTLCDAAETKVETYTDGISFLPEMKGDFVAQKDHDYLYWEHARKEQAVRIGSWKGIKKSPSSKIQLYNLHADPGETDDISASNPEVVDQMERIMKNCRTESKLYPLTEE